PPALAEAPRDGVHPNRPESRPARTCASRIRRGTAPQEIRCRTAQECGRTGSRERSRGWLRPGRAEGESRATTSTLKLTYARLHHAPHRPGPPRRRRSKHAAALLARRASCFTGARRAAPAALG